MHPLSPSKMWGQARILRAGTSNASGQETISNIQYGRPESWRFLLAARVLGGPLQTDVTSIAVRWDVATGIGTTRFFTAENVLGGGAQDFALFNFSVAAGQQPRSLPTKWATSTTSPLLRDGEPDTVLNRSVCEVIVGESIVVSARVLITCADPTPDPSEYTVECVSLWAPNVHIRPDWFAGKFLGELGGR